MLLNADTLKASLRHKLQKVDHDRVSAYSWILDQKKRKEIKTKKHFWMLLLMVSWEIPGEQSHDSSLTCKFVQILYENF